MIRALLVIAIVGAGAAFLSRDDATSETEGATPTAACTDVVSESAVTELTDAQLDTAGALCGAIPEASRSAEEHFALGLVHRQLGQDIQSADFRSAAVKGHCSATYYLSLSIWEQAESKGDSLGRSSVYTEVDSLINAAADCGDARARAQLFPFDKFKEKSTLRLLYEGKFDELRKLRFARGMYIDAFLTESQHLIGPELRACWSATFVDAESVIAAKEAATGNAGNPVGALANEKLIDVTFWGLFSSLGTSTSPLAVFRDATQSIASAHLKMLDSQFDCTDPVVWKLSNNLRLWTNQPRALVDQLTELNRSTSSFAEARAAIQDAAQ